MFYYIPNWREKKNASHWSETFWLLDARIGLLKYLSTNTFFKAKLSRYARFKSVNKSNESKRFEIRDGLTFCLRNLYSSWKSHRCSREMGTLSTFIRLYMMCGQRQNINGNPPKNHWIYQESWLKMQTW